MQTEGRLMEKYEKEIDEVTVKVKRDFLLYFDNKVHGKGYYNWTETDEKLIEMTVREMWNRKTR